MDAKEVKSSADESAGLPSNPQGVDPAGAASAAASVAKAPGDESLYESLLRYHEDDSDDDEESVDKKPSADEDDRKPAAKPKMQEKKRPRISRPYSNRQATEEPTNTKTPPRDLASNKQTSFYKSALAAAEAEGKVDTAPGKPTLYPRTSEVLGGLPESVVPPVLADERIGAVMLTSDSRSVNLSIDDDVLALQQVAELSLKETSGHSRETPKNVGRKASLDTDASEQLKLFEKIREQEERRQLEEALAVSKQESGGGTVDFIPRQGGTVDFIPRNIPSDIPREFIEEHLASERAQTQAALRNNAVMSRARTDPTSGAPRESSADFLISQQLAMEEYRHAHGRNPPGTPALPETQQRQQRQPGARLSTARRPNEELLKKGRDETINAMSNGTAHVVKCQGCGKRLHAPIEYSLVLCPNCKTVSPGQTYVSPRTTRPGSNMEKSDSFRRNSDPR